MRKIIQKTVGSIVDLKINRWLHFQQLKLLTQQTLHSVSKVFNYKNNHLNSHPTETFEQTMARLNLNDQQIKQKTKTLILITNIYLVISFCVFVYSIYLSTQGFILQFFLGLSITILTLANAFKHSFLCFQFKHKKLNITLKEWFNNASY